MNGFKDRFDFFAVLFSLVVIVGVGPAAAQAPDVTGVPAGYGTCRFCGTVKQPHVCSHPGSKSTGSGSGTSTTAVNARRAEEAAQAAAEQARALASRAAASAQRVHDRLAPQLRTVAGWTPATANFDASSSSLGHPGGSTPVASTEWKGWYYPAMLNNSYQKGYDALRNRDPAGAAKFFSQAQRELPNDAMVRDALDIAHAMLRIQALPPAEVPYTLFTEAQRTRVLPAPREPALINPLREPELYRAWEERVWRELAQRIQGDINGTIRKTYKDAELGRAIKPVWLHYCGAMADMNMSIQQEFESVMVRLARKYTTETNPNWARLEKENPQYQRELQELAKEFKRKKEEAEVGILRETGQKLLQEATAYFDRLPQTITKRTP